MNTRRAFDQVSQRVIEPIFTGNDRDSRSKGAPLLVTRGRPCRHGEARSPEAVASRDEIEAF